MAVNPVPTHATIGRPPVSPSELPDPAAYEPSPLHGPDRIWTETNCYVDLWIELLHAFGLEPLAVAAFTLSADFEGRQWSFFKPPLEDLRAVYGIEVGEINVWRPVVDHVQEELDDGRLLSVEVDSWWLPDTAGVSYHLDHVKTSIVPGRLDRAGRRLDYFHGAGYHRLTGDDFDGLFASPSLPPYTELIRLDGLRRDPGAQVSGSLALAAEHLGRRPATNPVGRLGAHLTAQQGWLSEAGPDAFHKFAFGTCRQCGAEAEVAASYLRWLGDTTGLALSDAADRFQEVAEGAKTLQFALARGARGRRIDVLGLVRPMADAWEAGISTAMQVLRASA